jgi:hypothetical protein
MLSLLLPTMQITPACSETIIEQILIDGAPLASWAPTIVLSSDGLNLQIYTEDYTIFAEGISVTLEASVEGLSTSVVHTTLTLNPTCASA